MKCVNRIIASPLDLDVIKSMTTMNRVAFFEKILSQYDNLINIKVIMRDISLDDLSSLLFAASLKHNERVSNILTVVKEHLAK